MITKKLNFQVTSNLHTKMDKSCPFPLLKCLWKLPALTLLSSRVLSPKVFTRFMTMAFNIVKVTGLPNGTLKCFTIKTISGKNLSDIQIFAP